MPRRTLTEIIERCHHDHELDPYELKCAVIALESLLVLQSSDMRSACLPLGRNFNDRDRKRVCEEDHRRQRTALAAVPEVWLGDRLPGNEDHLHRREVAGALMRRLDAKLKRQES